MPYLPLAKEAGQVHVCAHRGHSVGAPENTLSALDAASDHGATVAEIDVVLTRDDAIVLLHDEILDRTTNGKGRVADLDLDSVRRLDAGSWFAPEFSGTRIPTLQEALATARSRRIGLLVEIKERQRQQVMLDKLARFLRDENALEDILIISFDHVSLLRLKEQLPAVRTELITHARHVDPVGMAQVAKAQSVSIEWNMFHPDDARALHDAGIAVRASIPRPDRFALGRAYGFDDEARVVEQVAAGNIDVLAGDDTSFVRRLVDAAAL